ncbi:hypothetical protein [Streptomyces sp. NPDC094466]|uniref:hypothetical protein n=1 Tax=Streptomyces sp. NPDC094466 TaxID=3366065 RepID=UPI003819BD6C
MPCIKPVALGYVHAKPPVTAATLAADERQIHDYANKRGYNLCHIEWEFEGNIALGRLIGLLEHHEAEHLLVLSMENVTNHPVIELVIREAVTLDYKVELHEVASPLN